MGQAPQNTSDKGTNAKGHPSCGRHTSLLPTNRPQQNTQPGQGATATTTTLYHHEQTRTIHGPLLLVWKADHHSFGCKTPTTEPPHSKTRMKHGHHLHQTTHIRWRTMPTHIKQTQTTIRLRTTTTHIKQIQPRFVYGR